jgi:hypothetical protein
VSLVLHLAAWPFVVGGIVRLQRVRRRFPRASLKQADLETRRLAMRKIFECALIMSCGVVLLSISMALQGLIPRWVAVAYGAWAIGAQAFGYALVPLLVRR